MGRPGAVGQCLFGTFTKLGVHASPLRLYVCQAQQLGAASCNHDQINPLRQEVLPLPEALAADALDSIALGRIADLGRNHEADARRAGCANLRRHEQNEVRRRNASRPALDSKKIGAPTYPAVAPLFYYRHFLLTAAAGRSHGASFTRRVGVLPAYFL